MTPFAFKDSESSLKLGIFLKERICSNWLLEGQILYCKNGPKFRRESKCRVTHLESVSITLHLLKYVEACASRPPSSYAPDPYNVAVSKHIFDLSVL